MKIAVYVTLFGEKDSLKKIPEEVRGEADYFLYTDCITESQDYKIIHVDLNGENPRRLSRRYKLSPHKYLPEYDYHIYLDASIDIRVSPEYMINKYLTNHDIAVLKHPWRDCVYMEMRECLRINVADWDKTHEQARFYRYVKYPENNGLTENGVIIRRNTYIIREFNEFWEFMYYSFSERDQFSFCYCAWRMNLQYNIIPNNIRDRTEGAIKEFNLNSHLIL